MLDLFEPGEEAQDSRDADVRDERGGDAQVLERAAGLFGDERVRGAGGDEHRVALDLSHRLPDGEVERPRSLVVVGATGERQRRELLPVVR